MAPDQIETPVLIIGAGPAGCACSVFLSKRGIPHVIVDKARFPRDKVCGDAVSGKSLYVIRRADEDWARELFAAEGGGTLGSVGLSFFAPSGEELAIAFGLTPGGQPVGFTSTRLYFDNYLFNKLSSPFATIYQDAKIDTLRRKGSQWEAAISCEDQCIPVTARLLVAADGDKSMARKAIGLEDQSPKSSAVGLRAYYKGVTGLEANRIELHFLKELLPCYLWIFPLPEGRANVGVGMLSSIVRDKKINLRERMLDALQTNPALKARFAQAELEGKIAGWGLPMGVTQEPISGDGYLLTGDAAHLIDPFSGEGIGNALYSGMKAAEAIEAALAGNDCSAAFLRQQYDRPVYNRLWPELRISKLLQRLSNYPRLFNFIVHKANRSKTLKGTITGMFTNLDLREQLRRPSFYLKMLMNR